MYFKRETDYATVQEALLTAMDRHEYIVRVVDFALLANAFNLTIQVSGLNRPDLSAAPLAKLREIKEKSEYQTIYWYKGGPVKRDDFITPDKGFEYLTQLANKPLMVVAVDIFAERMEQRYIGIGFCEYDSDANAQNQKIWDENFHKTKKFPDEGFDLKTPTPLPDDRGEYE
ncbi:hypothetical protein [Agrobacterium rosae]|uniref:hypothetical protein n=1 Tax=Agrobacterium rosae TaxID=1972867 RepID=UPI000CD8BE38|nr:hypothetical protein [Agrobacterium rosae]POO56261.1 hypothetical protein CTT39_05870 [Agrobacterium rosae]